jgi:hypothetical protein
MEKMITQSLMRARKPRKCVENVVHSDAPITTRYFYLPGEPVYNLNFIKEWGGKHITTEFGDFVSFRKKIKSHKVQIRSMCAAPLRRNRFCFLLKMAMAKENTDFEDNNAMLTLKVKETRHLRTLIDD